MSVAVDVVNYMTLNSIIFCAGNEWRVWTSGGNIGRVKSLEKAKHPTSRRHFNPMKYLAYIFLYNKGIAFWLGHCRKFRPVVLPLLQCTFLKDSNTVGAVQCYIIFFRYRPLFGEGQVSWAALAWVGSHCLGRKGMLWPGDSTVAALWHFA